MNDLIAELDAWLQTNRPVYYASLQEPWTEAQFSHIQEMAGTELPVPFRALYGWKGGQSALSTEMLFADWRLLQFEEVRINYQTYNELHDMGEFKHPHWWETRWVPFLENEQEHLMCLDLAGSFDGTPGQLLRFQMRNPTRTIEYPDLPAFVTCLLQGYKEADTLNAAIRIPSPKGYPLQKRAG